MSDQNLQTGIGLDGVTMLFGEVVTMLTNEGIKRTTL